MEKLLATVVMWGAAIAAIVVVIFLVKDIIGAIKGEGSVVKIAVKVFGFVFLIGLVFMMNNVSQVGKAGGKVATSLVGKAANVIDSQVNSINENVIDSNNTQINAGNINIGGK